MTAASATEESQWRQWRAVADLYHAYFTGLILTVVTRRSTADAAEFVFQGFAANRRSGFWPASTSLACRICRPL